MRQEFVYKKIAILTDNNYMAERFLDIIKKYNGLVKYNFFVSPFSDINNFNKK